MPFTICDEGEVPTVIIGVSDEDVFGDIIPLIKCRIIVGGSSIYGVAIKWICDGGDETVEAVVGIFGRISIPIDEFYDIARIIVDGFCDDVIGGEGSWFTWSSGMRIT